MVSLVGQTDGITYRIHRELILEEGSIPDMCQLFWSTFPEHQAPIRLYGDATGQKRTAQTNNTDYFIIRNEMKSYGVPLEMQVPEANPSVPDRVNSVNRLLRDETGQVRLVIDTSCQELASDLEGVLRDNRGGILKINNRKDPYFRRTHTSDALGYWTNRCEPVRLAESAQRKAVHIARPQYGTRR